MSSVFLFPSALLAEQEADKTCTTLLQQVETERLTKLVWRKRNEGDS